MHQLKITSREKHKNGQKFSHFLCLFDWALISKSEMLATPIIMGSEIRLDRWEK